MFIEPFCVSIFSCFFLISGYFMVKSQFKLRRFFRLLAQVLFYTLLIPLVLSLFGIPIIAEQDGIYGILMYILPANTVHYWYITAYLLLYLLSPVINAGFEKIPQKQMGYILLVMLIYLSGIKSVIPFSLEMDGRGNDFAWFTFMYLVGAYIRIYGLPVLEKKSRGLILFLGSCIMIFVMKIGIYYIHAATGLLKYYYYVPFDINFILIFTAAIGLFCAFEKLEIKEDRASVVIRNVSPLVLGVYLLHINIDIKNNWYPWLQHLFGGLLEWGLPGRIVNLIVVVSVVFLVGILVDFIRNCIFNAVERRLIDELYAAKKNE
jgi:hypothetical protein